MEDIGEFLGRDHDRIDGLLALARGAGGEPLEAFAAALARHIRWEEDSAFPALVRAAGADAAPATDTMRLQHEEFARMIEDLRRCAPGDGLTRLGLEEVLLEALADHNKAEEDHIYPWLDGALTPAQKAGLLRALTDLQGEHHEHPSLAP